MASKFRVSSSDLDSLSNDELKAYGQGFNKVWNSKRQNIEEARASGEEALGAFRNQKLGVLQPQKPKLSPLNDPNKKSFSFRQWIESGSPFVSSNQPTSQQAQWAKDYSNFQLPQGLIDRVKDQYGVEARQTQTPMEFADYIAEHHPELKPTYSTAFKKAMTENGGDVQAAMKSVQDSFSGMIDSKREEGQYANLQNNAAAAIHQAIGYENYMKLPEDARRSILDAYDEAGMITFGDEQPDYVTAIREAYDKVKPFTFREEPVQEKTATQQYEDSRQDFEDERSRLIARNAELDLNLMDLKGDELAAAQAEIEENKRRIQQINDDWDKLTNDFETDKLNNRWDSDIVAQITKASERVMELQRMKQSGQEVPELEEAQAELNRLLEEHQQMGEGRFQRNVEAALGIAGEGVQLAGLGVGQGATNTTSNYMGTLLANEARNPYWNEKRINDTINGLMFTGLSRQEAEAQVAAMMRGNANFTEEFAGWRKEVQKLGEDFKTQAEDKKTKISDDVVEIAKSRWTEEGWEKYGDENGVRDFTKHVLDDFVEATGIQIGNQLLTMTAGMLTGGAAAAAKTFTGKVFSPEYLFTFIGEYCGEIASMYDSGKTITDADVACKLMSSLINSYIEYGGSGEEGFQAGIVGYLDSIRGEIGEEIKQGAVTKVFDNIACVLKNDYTDYHPLYSDDISDEALVNIEELWQTVYQTALTTTGMDIVHSGTGRLINKVARGHRLTETELAELQAQVKALQEAAEAEDQHSEFETSANGEDPDTATDKPMPEDETVETLPEFTGENQLTGTTKTGREAPTNEGTRIEQTISPEVQQKYAELDDDTLQALIVNTEDNLSKADEGTSYYQAQEQILNEARAVMENRKNGTTKTGRPEPTNEGTNNPSNIPAEPEIPTLEIYSAIAAKYRGDNELVDPRLQGKNLEELQAMLQERRPAQEAPESQLPQPMRTEARETPTDEGTNNPNNIPAQAVENVTGRVDEQYEPPVPKPEREPVPEQQNQQIVREPGATAQAEGQTIENAPEQEAKKTEELATAEEVVPVEADNRPDVPRPQPEQGPKQPETQAVREPEVKEPAAPTTTPTEQAVEVQSQEGLAEEKPVDEGEPPAAPVNTTDEIEEPDVPKAPVNQEVDEQTQKTARTWGYKAGSTIGDGRGDTGVHLANGVGGMLSNSRLRELSVIDKVAKRFGFSVEVVPSIEHGANGVYRGGRTVYINANTQNALETVAGHEMWHMVKHLSPKSADQIEKIFNKWAARTGFDLDTAIANKIEEYAENGVKLKSTDEAKEEIIANTFYRFFNDESTMRAVYAADRNLFTRVMDFVKKVQQTVREMLGDYEESTAEARMLAKQEGALDEMYGKMRKVLEEMRKLDDTKKTATKAKGNGDMTRRYEEAVNNATTNGGVTDAAIDLAKDTLRKTGNTANAQNISRIVKAAQKVANGMQPYYAMKQEGLNPDNIDPEVRRALMNLGAYAESLKNAGAAYQELLSGERELTAEEKRDAELELAHKDEAQDPNTAVGTRFNEAQTDAIIEDEAPEIKQIETGPKYSHTTFTKKDVKEGLSENEAKRLGIAYETKNIPHSTKKAVYATGREVLEATMRKYGKNPTQALEFLDRVANWMQHDAVMKFTYVGLEDINNAKMIIDRKTGQVLLSCRVSNGDYDVNFDFTKICKKRVAFSTFIDELGRRKGTRGGDTMLEEIKLDSKNLFQMNEILRDMGYETACLGCFVEARRYSVGSWAQSIVDDWNAAVLKENPNAEYFGFSTGDTTIEKLSEEEVIRAYNEMQKYETGKKGIKSPAAKMPVLAKQPSMQKLLRVSDLITSQGRTNLHKYSSELDSIAQSHAGTNTPKDVKAFAPYNSEIELLDDTKDVGGKTVSMQEYLKSIAGARSQSFSDFIMTHMFDHLQKTAALSARDFTAHTYTKEVARVALFGMTGEKINMSIMFEIDPEAGWWNAGLDKNGDYIVADYEHAAQVEKLTGKKQFTFSFPWRRAVELEHDPMYSRDCGIIGVGYSYFANMKMLKDENVPYIIGYHRSQMPNEIMVATNIEHATDYTLVQNTLEMSGFRHVNNAADGHGVPTYATWAQQKAKKDTSGAKGKSDATYDLKAALKRNGGDGIKTMREFLAWMNENELTPITKKASLNGKPQNGHGDFDFYGDLDKTENPRQTSSNYIAWCIENDMIPMFFEFSGEEEYYKYLPDFSVTDLATGEYAPQRPVSMDAMLEMGVDEWLKKADHYMGQYNDYMQRQYSSERFESTLEQIHDELAKEPTKYSLPSSERDAEYMKAVESGDEKKQDKLVKEAAKAAGYDTPKLYHGTGAFGFTEFDLDLGEQLIFATADKDVAETYSGGSIRSRISDKPIYNVDELHGEELISAAKKHLDEYKNYKLMTQAEREQEEKSIKADIQTVIDNINEFVEDNRYAFNEEKQEIVNGIIKAISDFGKVKDKAGYDAAFDKYLSSTWELKRIDRSMASELEFLTRRRLEMARTKLMFLIGGEELYYDANNPNKRIFAKHLREKLDVALSKGIYELYGKSKNSLVIDCNGSNWNEITPPESLKLHGKQRTRDIASAARDQGYNSVLLKNVYDTADGTSHAADVYIFFDSSQVKSADPIVYDDNGNVIPLSERFNTEKGDIRYSVPSRQQKAKLRNKIKDTEYKLRRMIERPDDKHFIPKQYMQDALDFVEAVMDADKAKRARGTLKWMRAVRQIKADTSNYTVAHTFPDDFVDLMQEAADLLNSKEINRMDADELVFVENVITEMYHRIRKAASMFKREKNASAYEEGKNAVETINKRKPYSNSGLARLAHNLVTDHLSPEREFNKLAGYEKDNAIARSSEEFADGSRVANKTKMDMTEYFEPLMTGENKKNFEKFTGKKAELIDTGIKSKKGGNIKITQDFRAALWLHSLNQDNLRGMRNGLTMPDLKLWQQGKFKDAWNQGERLKLSEEDLNRILSGVTEYEKQWAKAWQDMQAYSTPLLNKVALELNGWRKFNVENYFPIRRDGNYLATDFESLTMDARLANAGWTKARKHATNPMMFEPLTTVVNRTINGSSQYIGLAIPIENFNRMFNATMPGYEDSPKAAIRRVFGEKEYEYIERLLTDLNTGGRTVDPSFMDRLRSKAAGSALGANPTVVIKQAASYPTAASELGWSALSKALTSTRKFDEKLVKKYTSAYWERTADNIQAMNANVQANTLQKSSGFLSGAIAAMDRATVRKIWIACEYATEAENTALKRGTDEYYQEVARKFEHVLERTQPEYGVWQRPHVLRSNNPLVKGISMYKTQAMQNWNILYDAIADFSAQSRRYKADKSAKNKAEVDRARTTLARAVSSQVVSAAVLAIMTAVGKGLLHKPEPYQDDKGEITPESVSYQLGKDAISSLAGMMVGGSELFELITGIAEGKQPYDIEASQISMVNDLYQAIYKMGSAVTAIGNSNLSTEQKQEKGKKAVETFLQSVGAIYGVPVRNLENVAKSVYQYTTDIISGKTFQEMMTGDVSMTAGARHMGEALANGDTETYTRLYNRLLQQGKSTSQINSALKSWLKSNDQRIRQAAEAIDSGDLNTYNRLINEMVDDGYGMANVVTSIEAVRKDMVKGDTEEVATEYTPMTYDDIIKAQNNEQTDEYTYSQLNQLLENGNTQAARKLQSELFKSKGTTKVKSALTSYWKPKYREAYQSRNRAELNRIVRLLKTMGYSDATINKWKEVDSTTSNSKKKTGFGSSSFGSAFGKSNKKKSTSKFGGR